MNTNTIVGEVPAQTVDEESTEAKVCCNLPNADSDEYHHNGVSRAASWIRAGLAAKVAAEALVDEAEVALAEAEAKAKDKMSKAEWASVVADTITVAIQETREASAILAVKLQAINDGQAALEAELEEAIVARDKAEQNAHPCQRSRQRGQGGLDGCQRRR